MFKEIVDRLDIAVVVSDLETRTIIYANDSVRRVLDMPMDKKLMGESTNVLYSTGKSFISNEELTTFNQEVFWERKIVTAKGKYLKLKGRETIWDDRRAYAIYIIDETAEQELIHNVPGALTIVELLLTGECRVTFANNSWLEMMDVSWPVFQEVYGSDFFGLVYHKDKVQVRDVVAQNWGKNKILLDVFRVTAPDGRMLYLTANLMLRKIDGKLAQYYCVFTDVSSQIETRRSYQKSQRQLKLIQENTNLTLWEIDFTTRELIPDEHSASTIYIAGRRYPYPKVVEDSKRIDTKSKEQFMQFLHSLQIGENPDPKGMEIMSTNAEGKQIWQLIKGAVMDWEDDKPAKGLLWCRDITEQKQMENIYINRISKSLNISDKIEVAFVFDLADNRIIESSSNNFEMFSKYGEIKVDEYLDWICSRSDQKDKLAETLNKEAMIESFHKGNRRGAVRYHQVAKKRDYECSFELLMNPYNSHLEAFVSFQDVTEAVEMEHIIQSLMKMNYEYIYTLNLGDMEPTIYATTESGNIQRMMDEGMNYDEYMREHLSRLGIPSQMDNILEENRLERVLQELDENGSYNTHFSVMDPTGKTNQVRRMKSRYRYIDSKKDVLLIALADITEEYETEQREQLKLEVALQEANAANMAKTDFLSRMSHDIRTPLNAILGLAKLAKDEQTSPTVRQYIDQINSSGEFLLRLVNDILDMSKIENGELEFHPEPFTAQEFSREINTIMEPLVKEQGIHFHMNLPSTKKAFMVDRLRFNQIFFHLLSNAVKFTPRGGDVYFYTEMIPARDGKVGFRHHVKDTGIGMSEIFLQKVFEPFEQEPNNLVDISQGTGLGTTIVKRIVDAMGGNIQVDSELGDGTEFIVDLYLEPADGEQQKTLHQSMEDVQAFLKNKRVLLVEDNEMNILVAKMQLKKMKIVVEEAHNGQEAVEAFANRTEDYDAILMDRRMPVMDGIEATREIRRIDAKVPIIAMTADAFDDDTRKSLEAGMNAHLTKPVVPETLYRTLVTCMQVCDR